MAVGGGLRGHARARELLRQTARKERWHLAESRHGEAPDEVARSEVAARDVRRQLWRHPLWTTLVGAGWMWGALWLMGNYTESSHPVILAVEVFGLMGAPIVFLVGVFWMVVVAGERRDVRRRHWVDYPAHSATMRYGPLRRTVVGVEITPTTTLVLFPEFWFRGRIRRLVEQEGQVLVLLPRSKKLNQTNMYAGPTGRPVFRDNDLASDVQGFWEPRGLAALARSEGAVRSI